MNGNIFTEEMRIELQQLEHEEANRKAKARLATKKWQEAHPDYKARAKLAQQKWREEKRMKLYALRSASAIAQKAIKEGDIKVHDASMDQML